MSKLCSVIMVLVFVIIYGVSFVYESKFYFPQIEENEFRTIAIKKSNQNNITKSESIERNVYNQILAHERHARNFIFTFSGLTIAIIGLMSMFGVNVFIKKIANKAEEDLRDRINLRTAFSQSTVFNHVGFFKYIEYIQLGSKVQKEQKGIDLLSHAITSTEHAYEAFELLNEDEIMSNPDCMSELNKLKDFKHQVMANLAYYLALRNNTSDSSKALFLAGKAFAASNSKINSRWYEWQESYAFVLHNFGSDHQKVYAIKIIKELQTETSITDASWINEITEDWKDLL